MTAPLVEFSLRNGVVYAEIDNYARRNALTADIMRELVEGARAYLTRDRAAVIVVSGKGGVFSSGIDVRTVRADSRDVVDGYLFNREFDRHLADFASLPMIKIAKIEGYCYGVGVVLASYCDVRLAATDALFCLPELDLGVMFGGAAFDRIVYHLGMTKAMDLLLSARRMPAQEGAEIGFLTAAVAPEDLASHTTQYAERAASLPTFLLMQTALTAQTTVAAAVRPPSAEIDGPLLAALDEGARAQNHRFAARFTDSAT